MGIINKEGSRYGEIILDTFYSRDETATYVDNVMSNRTPLNVNALAVHQGKIPLTYKTIFSPYNFMKFTWTDYSTYAPTAVLSSGKGPAYFMPAYVESTPDVGIMRYVDGTPNIDTARSIFTKSILPPIDQISFAALFRLGSPYTFIPPFINTINQGGAPPAGNFGPYPCRAMGIGTLGIDPSGRRFNLYIVFQVENNPASMGKITLSYPPYLGRKMGMPDGGTWVIDTGLYTPINTTGSTTPETDEPYVPAWTGSSWVNYGLPGQSWFYYKVPFPFNFEMNMGRSLILRGSLSTDTQSMIYMNNEQDLGSDILSVLPVNGNYGDIMVYDTPNYELFSLPKPIAIRSIKLWFTRSEDPTNTPIQFDGADYWLKLACSFLDEYSSVPNMDTDTGQIKQTSLKRLKL